MDASHGFLDFAAPFLDRRGKHMMKCSCPFYSPSFTGDKTNDKPTDEFIPVIASSNDFTMPSEYECDNCKLNFSIGWFHYHDLSSGYGAETLLVCKACGTVHCVEHPTRGATVHERLRVQPGPRIDPPKLFAGRAIHYRDWIGDEPTAGRKFRQLSCMHCHAVGTLFDRWPLLGAACPKCGNTIRRSRSSWMT